ncbi:MAG: ubiquitin-like protein Pup [Nesterenkonia sp.]
MAAQPQKQPHRPGGDDDQNTDEAVQAKANPQSQQQAEELDSLLDEIDTVLESNAEEFVGSFVQKGGQ